MCPSIPVELASTPDPRALIDNVRAFAHARIAGEAARIDRDDDIGPALLGELAQLGLFAIDQLADRGNALGGSAHLQLVLGVIEELARVSPAVAKAVMDQNFGQVGMLRDYAPPAIRDHYLGQIQRGAMQAAFLMTEPRSGSDVRQFETVAERVSGGYVVSGVKDWITGAATRQLYFVVAKPARDANVVGLFLVDRTRPASELQTIEVSDRKAKLGLRGLGEHRVELRHVFVPDEAVVLDFAGGSLGKIMKHYNVKRCGQAAISIGLSKAAMRAAVSYAAARFAVGSPPRANLEAVLAPLVGELKAAETLTVWAAERLAAGDVTGAPSGMAKYVATELAVRITNASMQVCGANGMSSKLPIERLMRDARMLTIAGGASEVLRGTIARHLERLLA